MNWEGKVPAEPKRQRVANGEWRVANSERRLANGFWRAVLLHCREIPMLNNCTQHLALRTNLGFASQTPNKFVAQKIRHQPLAKASGMVDFGDSLKPLMLRTSVRS